MYLIHIQYTFRFLNLKHIHLHKLHMIILIKFNLIPLLLRILLVLFINKSHFSVLKYTNNTQFACRLNYILEFLSKILFQLIPKQIFSNRDSLNIFNSQCQSKYFPNIHYMYCFPNYYKCLPNKVCRSDLNIKYQLFEYL